MPVKRILFVDDEPVVLKLMKTRLESRGFEVETAPNGLEGIAKSKEWRPDAILLDVVMPGLDGFETCKRLKETEETRSIPVFLFTASQDGTLHSKAEQAGAHRLVQKPHVEQLIEAVSEFFK